MWKVPVLALLAVTSAIGPALAAATDWQEIAPGVTARLIVSDRIDDGHMLGGLELRMPPGTKTYWRIPGETGIPTEFDFAASVAVANPTVHWPFPLIEQDQGYLDYVYRGDVVLPFTFEPGEGATLDAAVTLGLCSDICVPANARFVLPLGADKADVAQSIRLDQAMAETPILWDQPEPALSGVSIGPGGTLYIEAPDTRIDPQNFIVDAGDPAILFQAPQKSRETGIWTLKPLAGVDSKGLEGEPVQLTFRTPMGPYAVTRTVISSDPA